MKKDVILIVEKVWVNSLALILLTAIVFMMISFSLPEEDHQRIFTEVFLAILFSVGLIMGLIYLTYQIYKKSLFDVLSKEDSTNKPE
jgi:uncharacterized membrane protein